MASRVVFSNRIPLARAMENLLAASSGSALRPAAVAGGVRGYNAGAPLRSYDRDEAVERSPRSGARERDVGVPSFFSGSRHPAPCLSLQRVGFISPLRDLNQIPTPAACVTEFCADCSCADVFRDPGEKESDREGADAPRYSGRLELAGDVYRMDQIKAEMKNGVLRVVVPKVKEEERKDVFEVKVD
ncbi:unnamed protein product [Triticum turgidum subsp. durum]|uniref:SHSP domain-containing protein n=1 Tax=Triticum turgidum subsp. durum TaxID=4567 RepID=A0A9R0Y755_TRITD|nr:unnamed protein product [Triticum turgidum subsp. durum]